MTDTRQATLIYNPHAGFDDWQQTSTPRPVIGRSMAGR